MLVETAGLIAERKLKKLGGGEISPRSKSATITMHLIHRLQQQVRQRRMQ